MFDKKEYTKEWFKKHPEYRERWKEGHKEHVLEYRKEYYKKNKEFSNKINKQWRADNKESISEYSKQYRKDNPKYRKQWKGINPEYDKIYQKKWFKTDKGKAAAQRGRSKRRAKEKEIINTLTSQEWLDILKQYNYKCVYCGKDLFDLFTKPEKDHKTPISKGGNNVKENVVPACRSCNAKKHNKILLKEEEKING